MRDFENIAYILAGVIWLVIKIASEARKAKQQAPASRPAPKPKPKPPPRRDEPVAPMGAPLPQASVFQSREAAARSPDGPTRKALARLGKLERRTAKLSEAVQLERPNRRFADTLTAFVPHELSVARAMAERGDLALASHATDMIEMVVDEVRLLARQRRDPALLAELGDADAFADACYAPIVAFAKAEGLPLTTGYPVTQLTEFDLAIWTGFIPTSLAPIFLPRDFFSSTSRWPALAHEVGHDFLVSVEGLEPRLRRELGLPSAEVGSYPLSLSGGGLEASELVRVFGAWFEELFCDVFGTLMCGPAYVATMIALFAAEGDPREVLVVDVDATGVRYDVHPPRHLRVQVCCMVLDRSGLRAEVRELSEAWSRRHEGAELDSLLFPIGRQYLALPLTLFLEIAGTLVERLYAGPLKSLNGFGLQGVSGLDYGPHEHMQASRARDALLAGEVPAVRDIRAVIAGAVLAAQRRPEREAQILKNARAAIPAVGTSERRPDAYDIPEAPAGGRAMSAERQAVLEALVLREVLGPPKALAGRPRRPGL